MAKTASKMLPLGTIAPDFSLLDTVTDKTIHLKEIKGKTATVLMFICNHCPFVKHVNPQLTQLAQDYKDKGIQFIAINSNDVENYPDDSPDKMKENARAHHYPFPYLFDETQEVASAYQAACTPDFYIFDSKLSLAYRGQLDDSRPGNEIPVTGESIRDALDCLIKNKPLHFEQKSSLGCNIKWKNK